MKANSREKSVIMKFVKLHIDGQEILVNLSTVSEVYPVARINKSILYFNFATEGGQVTFRVDESIDEILHLSKLIH